MGVRYIFQLMPVAQPNVPISALGGGGILIKAHWRNDAPSSPTEGAPCPNSAEWCPNSAPSLLSRNSSMDEFMLQQLRTGGIAYHSQPDEISDRSATMSRIQGKKSKDKTKGLLLRHVPSDEAALSEGTYMSVCLYVCYYVMYQVTKQHCLKVHTCLSVCMFVITSCTK